MAPFVDGLRARGVEATAIDLPKRKAEDALPAFHLVVPDGADVAVGGHSFGGRVASLAAAEPDAPYAGLVLFSYPLHPPGSPERTDARIAHWPDIRCPVLLLSGESDPFAKIDLLRASVPRLAQAELGHVSAAGAHAEARPRRRAGPGCCLPARAPDGLTGTRHRRRTVDRLWITRLSRAIRVRILSVPQVRRPDGRRPNRSRRRRTPGDPAVARRAHRVVPVGRSSIASAVRPPEGGPRRESRGDHPHRCQPAQRHPRR